jgi:hypothetical protein
MIPADKLREAWHIVEFLHRWFEYERGQGLFQRSSSAPTKSLVLAGGLMTLPLLEGWAFEQKSDTAVDLSYMGGLQHFDLASLSHVKLFELASLSHVKLHAEVHGLVSEFLVPVKFAQDSLAAAFSEQVKHPELKGRSSGADFWGKVTFARQDYLATVADEQIYGREFVALRGRGPVLEVRWSVWPPSTFNRKVWEPLVVAALASLRKSRSTLLSWTSADASVG